MTKKKSIWGKMTSMVYDSGETAPAQKAEATEAAPATAQATTTFNMDAPAPVVMAANPVATVPSAQMTGQFNQEIYNGLLELLAQHDLEGIDYLEFTNAKKALDAMVGLTEAQKIVAAFSTLKVSAPALTKDSILETADHYINVLSQEQAGFETEMDGEVASEVTAKRDLAVEKQAKIVELQAEIVALNAESAAAENNINAIRSNFEATMKVVQVGIQNDKQNIAQFIVEATPTV